MEIEGAALILLSALLAFIFEKPCLLVETRFMDGKVRTVQSGDCAYKMNSESDKKIPDRAPEQMLFVLSLKLVIPRSHSSMALQLSFEQSGLLKISTKSGTESCKRI